MIMWKYADAEWKSNEHQRLVKEGYEAFAIAPLIKRALNLGGVIDHVEYTIMVYLKKYTG
jgi:hypothetical protein